MINYVRKVEETVSNWPGVSVSFDGREFVFGVPKSGTCILAGSLIIPFPRSIRDVLLAEGRSKFFHSVLSKEKCEMENMKAVRVHNYGGPEVLRFEDAPCPTPGSSELLIRVHAASVNPIDWKIRAGYMKDYIPLPLPFIPGWDVSGVVEAVGSGVTKFKKGDEVYARPDVAAHGSGAYAEYVVAKETETALKPKSIDHVHAATIPVGAVTAWRALFDAAGLKEGQKVLIHGAAGGVGSFAVQLAKWKGAYVIGTASTRNQAFLRQLGVDEPIDYEKARFEDVVHDVDVVFDPIGGDTQKRSWKVLKKGGILVSIVGPPSEGEAVKHGVRSAFLSAQGGSSLLAELATLVDSGKIKPIVETVLPLSEAIHAHELSETGHARGKIVLKVA
jgi:NADPH:quinone reductase-like Zn-dependent oxidoreductase